MANRWLRHLQQFRNKNKEMNPQEVMKKARSSYKSGGGNGGEEERRRILAALDANNWRRQDTAATLGISRKVLWEKMRKYQIADGETELRELE